MPAPRPEPFVFSSESSILGGRGGVGVFGAISSFASRRRGRCCVRLAGIAFCKADEPTFWPRSDYGRFFGGSLTSTQTAGIGNLHVRTCSRTTRVTALRMGGFEVARWREKICCVIPKRVAGVGFATFMEHTSLLRFFENHWFLLVSPSCSRIRRKMMRFWLSRDGLCLCAFCAAAHIADAHATHLHPLRSTAHAHMRTMRICA